MAYAAEREKYFPSFSLILLLKVMRGGRGTLWAGGGGAAKPISQQQANGERESFLFFFFGSDLTGGTITLFCVGGTQHNRSKEFPRYIGWHITSFGEEGRRYSIMVGGGGILQNVKAGMQRLRRWYFVLFRVFPQFPPHAVRASGGTSRRRGKEWKN